MSKRLPIKEEAAFREYCLLGADRSLEKLYQVYQNGTKYVPNQEQRFQPSLSMIKKWSNHYDWQNRVAKWDEEQFQARLKREQKARDDMNIRHAQIGTREQIVALNRIEELRKTGDLGAHATVQLLDLALKTERLALGAATERREVAGAGARGQGDQQEEQKQIQAPGGNMLEGDLSWLSDEEYLMLQSIYQKWKARQDGSSSG